eukprot:1799766-Pyramimonas_sp.AAC.1
MTRAVTTDWWQAKKSFGCRPRVSTIIAHSRKGRTPWRLSSYWYSHDSDPVLVQVMTVTLPPVT